MGRCSAAWAAALHQAGAVAIAGRVEAVVLDEVSSDLLLLKFHYRLAHPESQAFLFISGQSINHCLLLLFRPSLGLLSIFPDWDERCGVGD
ncbi:MAG TPA: hypothetical protein V6C69_01515 [Trichormus sp.]